MWVTKNGNKCRCLATSNLCSDRQMPTQGPSDGQFTTTTRELKEKCD